VVGEILAGVFSREEGTNPEWMQCPDHTAHLELINQAIQVELKVISFMLAFKVIGRCPRRAPCILIHICACFHAGSLKENRILYERLFT
jgi:hypothetical protein